jgi:hypothetical protein
MTDIADAAPRDQALSVAVPGARGWFRFSDNGRVNVRTAGVVQTPQYDDGLFRVVVTADDGIYELRLGPYEDGGEAGDVCDAVVQLAYDDAAWPAPPAATT